MRRPSLIVVLAALLVSAAAEAAGPLDLVVEYSADAVIGTGEQARPGKLWRTPMALRLETQENGRPQTVIVRVDRNLALLLVPEMRLAIETDLSGLSLTQALLGSSDRLKSTSLGPDTVEGTRTTRWRVETSDPKAGWFRGFVWSTDRGVVMKIEGEGEHRNKRGYVHLLFRNVKIAPQDGGLFEPPGDYRRLPVSDTMLDSLLRGIEQLDRMRGGAPRQ
ncbi:MAG: hypothetical protein FJX55_05565 [Alphaproteobacteria bacterium]|nr:hypothetical protein [Alphaproteobacteria bacterium]